LEQLVTIELFGQPYTFKTESELIRAKQVADYLVSEIARVENQHDKAYAKLGKLTVMILTALNIANENMQLRNNQLNFIDDLSKRSEQLIRRIEPHIQ
jgi:cell division protein ZapA (FtsZ GTPase activity inhibitor)